MNQRKAEFVRILIVDDEEALLKSAKECLKIFCAYEIDVASSVKIAYEMMSLNDYDLIVCDVNMPITGGFEFLKSLRDKGSDIPFIVFTVTDDKENAIEAYRLGANGFVGKYGKPEVVFSILSKSICEALRVREKRCENSKN